MFLRGFLSIKFDKSENYLHQISAFYDFPFLKYNKLDFPLERLFLLGNLPGLPTTNKITNSYPEFLILNKRFAGEYNVEQNKRLELQNLAALLQM